MSWQLLLFISVIGFSLSVLLQRVLLHDYKTDPHAYAIVFQGMVAVFIAVYALAFGFVMPDFGRLWPGILLTFLFYGVGNIAYAKSLQRIEASVFTVLFATHALWVMLLSYFLFQERLTLFQVAGSILIFVSVGLLAERKGQFKLSKGLILGLATGVLYGLAVTAWVWVSRRTDDIDTWNALSFAGPALVVLMIKPKSAKKLSGFMKMDVLKRISLLSLLFAVSAATLLHAFNKGQAGIIAPLRQTSIILTIVLAVILLKEKDRLRRKTTAGLICFIGVILIVL